MASSPQDDERLDREQLDEIDEWQGEVEMLRAMILSAEDNGDDDDASASLHAEIEEREMRIASHHQSILHRQERREELLARNNQARADAELARERSDQEKADDVQDSSDEDSQDEQQLPDEMPPPIEMERRNSQKDKDEQPVVPAMTARQRRLRTHRFFIRTWCNLDQRWIRIH